MEVAMTKLGRDEKIKPLAKLLPSNALRKSGFRKYRAQMAGWSSLMLLASRDSYEPTVKKKLSVNTIERKIQGASFDNRELMSVSFILLMECINSKQVPSLFLLFTWRFANVREF